MLSLAPTHILCIPSHCQPVSAKPSNNGNCSQPTATRLAVSGQLRIPHSASTASTLQAPTAHAAANVSLRFIPLHSPLTNPAIVASPAPLLPAPSVFTQGAQS